MQVAILTAVFLGSAALPLMAQDYDECRHEAQRSANVDARGARRLLVGAGSGSLKIEGKPGLTTVRITGRACASSPRSRLRRCPSTPCGCCPSRRGSCWPCS